MTNEFFDSKSFSGEQRDSMIDEVTKAIEAALEKGRQLDPVDPNITVAEAIRIAKRDVSADVKSALDAVKHFSQSIKHLPLYPYVESAITQMVLTLVSIDRLNRGEEPLVALSHEAPSKLIYSNLLSATFNHYHGSAK